RNITYRLEGVSGDAGRGHSHSRCPRGAGLKDVHQDFDKGGFAGTVGPNQGIDGALRDVEIDMVESHQPQKALAEFLRSNRAGHRPLRPPRSESPPNFFQCRASEPCTSSSEIPSRFASTTICSICAPNNSVR